MSGRVTQWKSWLSSYSELITTWVGSRGNCRDAEDAVQDIAETLLQKDISAIRDTKAYLYRSAFNGLAQRYTQQQRRATLPLHILSEQDHPAVDDALSAVYIGQLTDALIHALAELPPIQQQVFAWHRLEQWTIPEIAKKTGLSTSSIEKYLANVMKHLHSRLRAYAP